MILPDALLGTPLARELYHGTAKALPIIDYHCHLDPIALAEDRRYPDPDALLVADDPYKHRLMRLAGVPEAEITGAGADPRRRFRHWAATLPLALGNPLHHWSRLEFSRGLGIDEALGPDNADRLWDLACARLTEPGRSARGLLRGFGTEVVVTSDLLLDDLAAHQVAKGTDSLRMLPSLRGDDLVAVANPSFTAWTQRLATRTGRSIANPADYRAAVEVRLDAFAALGCRIADHALDDCAFLACDEATSDLLLRRRLAGEELPAEDALRLRSALLASAIGSYARRGWTLLLHVGAQRRTSSRLRRLAGPAGGYAGIAGPTDLAGLTALLDACEVAGGLPRCAIFPLNPADWAAAAVLTGSFAADGRPGLVQFGPAWWWDDHAVGIRSHLDLLSSHALLGTFIGMCTDARTVPSQIRHEYFRRLLCDWLGRKAAEGLLPGDAATLVPLVRACCHDNARRFILGDTP
jgi:glucuronate isomerase